MQWKLEFAVVCNFLGISCDERAWLVSFEENPVIELYSQSTSAVGGGAQLIPTAPGTNNIASRGQSVGVCTCELCAVGGGWLDGQELPTNEKCHIFIARNSGTGK